MTNRRLLPLAVALVVATGTLAYLRDPAWLLHTESGFRGWEVDPAGRRFRWMNGHASFFVPSLATSVTIPVGTTYDEGDWPITVSISIDDRIVDRLELTDAEWRHSRVRLPDPGSRRVRRIDLRADRTRPGNRAIKVGEIQIRLGGR